MATTTGPIDLVGVSSADLGAIAALGRPDDQTALPGWVRELSINMPVDELVDLVVERDVRIAFPDLADNAEFLTHLAASVRENLGALQRVLAGDLPMSQVRLLEPVKFAAFQAEAHLPQTSLQRSYRVGFFTFWHEWARHCVQYAERLDVPREEALRTLVRLTQVIVSYQDHVASQVADVYSRAETELRQSSAHVRRRLVKDILAGTSGTLTGSELATLGYDLDAWHVAVLLPDLGEHDAERVLQVLRAELSTRQTLKQPMTATSTVFWVQRARPWDHARLAVLHSALSALEVTASLGDPSQGMDGLRESYEQAMSVEHIRALTGATASPRILTHADVALDVLLMHDVELARSFVQRELGRLAGDSNEAARLCETLEVSYSAGTHTAAAAVLGVHEHTIRNRLRRIEELLGRDSSQRRAETQVALRLRRLLQSTS